MTRDEITERMAPSYAVRVLNPFQQRPQSRVRDGVQILDTDTLPN